MAEVPLSEADNETKFQKLLRFEAAKRAHEIAAKAQRECFEALQQADALEMEARRKMETAENELLGKESRHG